MIIITTKKRLEKKLRKANKEGEREGLWNIVELLKKKDKIYLDEVRLKGDRHTIQDCVMFGKPNKSCVYIEK